MESVDLFYGLIIGNLLGAECAGIAFEVIVFLCKGRDITSYENT